MNGATILGMAVGAPAALLIPFAPAGHAAIPFLALSGMLGGFGAVVYNIQQVSLRQAITPERLQGRMNASMRFFVWGTIPLGSLVGGALATAFGVRTALLVGACLGFVSLLPVLLSPLRTLREFPEQEEVPLLHEPGLTEGGPAAGRRLARYLPHMPELPEMEAWRRQLNDPVSAFPIAKAGPAHIATLKTFDPPLDALEGRRLRGAERRGKRLLFPTDDGELVLLVHLMTAGRLKFLPAGEKGPKTPAFALEFQGGSKLVLTENARKKRAGVWLLTPEAAEAELAHLGPEALGLGPERLGEIVHGESRRLHALLRDQRLIAGIGRAWANEILHAAKLSPYALSARPRRRGGGAARGRDRTTSSSAASQLREAGASDEKTYRVHRRLGEPCHVCGTPIAQVDFEEHTIFYCPTCQTGGRVLKDRRLSRLLR